MMRTGLTEIILFAAPFVLYAVFLWVTKSNVLEIESWPLPRLISLAIVALLLVIGSFIFFAHFYGEPPGSTYVPAHIDENGNFVPATTK